MKRVIVILVLAVAGVSQAGVTGINVLAEEHHIYGAINDAPRFDITSNTPVSQFYDDGPLRTDPPNDPWGTLIGGFASAAAGNFSVSVAELSHEIGYALAESTYSFMPNSGNLQLDITFAQSSATWGSVSVSGPPYLEFYLEDISLGTTIDHLGGFPSFITYQLTGIYSATGSYSGNYIVDPTHEYKLSLMIEVVEGAGEMDVNLTSIPEPTTLLLLGLGSLMLRRKR